MKKVVILILLLLIIILSSCNIEQESGSPTLTPTVSVPSGEYEYTVMVNDLERSYLLYIPPDITTKQPLPIVFAFHGYTVSPKDMRTTSQFNKLADMEKFLVVYPMGIEFSWNTGWQEGTHDGYALVNNVDDLAFIREILTDLGSFAEIDPKRVFAAGHSQGGMLVYRLACEMSDTFAAIAAVAATNLHCNCNPSDPVSVLHIHGLSDPLVNFSGGGTDDFPPVEEGIETWVTINNCSDSVTEEDEESGITHVTYAPCKAGTTVQLYTIESGVHTWYLTETLTNEFIWDFFVAHPKP